ncbi:MAG TPA: hypothetical protein VGK24_07100 [Candidatus Angelobacter sp.]|jgi:ABC-type amino acid transport system permease subunit
MLNLSKFFQSKNQNAANKTTNIALNTNEVGKPWSYLLVLAIFSVIVVVSYSGKPEYRQAAFVLTISICAIVIGMFLGFLFGVPRTVQDEQPTDKSAGTQSQNSGVSYRANTNLEQISDWLTKILVGVGLTQLTKIPEKLGDLGDFLKMGMDGSNAARSFGILVFLFFMTFGFLVGFLWTRLYLGKELKYADLGVLARQIEEIKSQPDKDARALSLVMKQLNPTSDAPPPSEEELKQAIKDASASTRLLIFEQARNARKLSSPTQSQQLERVLPVLRALVAADDAQQFHRNYGQLGYVLKEKIPPDFQGSIDALSNAIQIRNRLNISGYQLYELNRAQCRIGLYPRASDDQKQQIIADIKVALKVDPNFCADPAITNWLTQNNVKI